MTPDQKQRIHDYLISCTGRKFERGVWDCAIFCADILRILKGVDLAAPYRGAYSDREGAINVLPCRLDELPEYVGLTPSGPVDGAVWWSPSKDPEGALGILWQGQAIQPGRHGVKSVIRDFSNLKFFS